MDHQLDVCRNPSPGPGLTPNPDAFSDGAHVGPEPKSFEPLEQSLEASQANCPTPRAFGHATPRPDRHTHCPGHKAISRMSGTFSSTAEATLGA